MRPAMRPVCSCVGPSVAEIVLMLCTLKLSAAHRT